MTHHLVIALCGKGVDEKGDFVGVKQVGKDYYSDVVKKGV